jgi:hypothetical protein
MLAFAYCDDRRYLGCRVKDRLGCVFILTPLPIITVVMLAISVQFFLMGLLAELVGPYLSRIAGQGDLCCAANE